MNAVSPDLDRRFRDAAARTKACSTSPTTSSTRRSARCWSRRARAASAGSPTTPTPSGKSSSSRTFGLRVLRAPKPIDAARRELDEYFEGKRHSFDLPVDVALLADFNRRVLRELARVPYGEVVTYGELAARSARPRAARAVGMVMNRNPLPIVLPCHRVIGANGKLTGYAGGLERKETLLRLEGAIL